MDLNLCQKQPPGHDRLKLCCCQLGWSREWTKDTFSLNSPIGQKMEFTASKGVEQKGGEDDALSRERLNDVASDWALRVVEKKRGGCRDRERDRMLTSTLQYTSLLPKREHTPWLTSRESRETGRVLSYLHLSKYRYYLWIWSVNCWETFQIQKIHQHILSGGFLIRCLEICRNF